MKRLLVALAAFYISASAQALTIHIDYTYDASGFFTEHDPLNPDASTLAHATIEKAAKDLGDALTAEANASLNSVMSSHFESGNGLAAVDWSLGFRNPSTVPPADPSDMGNQITISDFSHFSADVFTVYAGAASSTGSTELGEGAPASVSESLGFGGAGDEQQNYDGVVDAVALSNGFMLRGAGPTIYSIPGHVDVGELPYDYTLNVGSVAGFLSVTSGVSWHVDYKTMPTGTEYDLYSVVLHEMIHALGFGSSVTWASMRAMNNADWTGSHVIALRGNGTNVLDGADQSAHVKETEMSTTLVATAGVPADTAQAAVMSPTLTLGTRRTLTHLDMAFLLDLGYGPPSPAPTPSTTPLPTPTPTPTATPTPTPEPDAPLTPVLKGKPPKSTSLSKIKLGGTLLSPGSYVIYKVGKGSYVKAKGGSSWKAVIKLKSGKNIIYIASFDPVTGKTSKAKKIVIKKL